jgi:hypothetical protein
VGQHRGQAFGSSISHLRGRHTQLPNGRLAGIADLTQFALSLDILMTQRKCYIDQLKVRLEVIALGRGNDEGP